MNPIVYHITALMAVVLIAPSEPTADDSKADLQALEGAWDVTSIVAGGKKLGLTEAPLEKAVIKDGKATFFWQGKEIATFKDLKLQIDAKQKPKTVDLVREGSETLPCIYKIENDEWVLAMPLIPEQRAPGEPLPRPKSFDSKDQLAVVLTAQRTKKGAGEEPARYTEKAGRFSFVPPVDWTLRRFQRLEYRVVIGPVKEGFVANMNVVLEPVEGTLDDYVKANKPVLEKVHKKFKLLEEGELKTKSGLRGVRLIIENEQNDRLLRQSMYLFGTADRKYIVTCTTLAEDGAKFDKLFEQAMETFRLED